MKRFLTLALAVLMLAFTVACDDVANPLNPGIFDVEAPDTPVLLQAGFGRVKITPENTNGTLKTPIEVADGQFAYTVVNDIYASAIAVSDGTKTILLMTSDLRDMHEPYYNRVIATITAATGIPKEQILFSSTHNHSAPELSIFVNPVDTAATEQYVQFLERTVYQAAVDAIADLSPASMQAGRSETDRLSFIRRYQLSDGTWASQVRDERFEASKVARHEGEIDEELQTVRWVRDGKKDIIMTNWQCHPALLPKKTTNGKTDYYINADWIHYMRQGVESNQDAYFAYFQGGAGNINNMTYITGEKKYAGDTVAGIQSVGNELASVVLQSLNNMEAIPAGHIYTSYTRYNGRHNIFVTSIGDFALTGNPFEMFCQSGKYVKDNSAAKMTFFVSYSNGHGSYLPPADLYDHGGYEVDVCWYRGETADHYTAEKICQHMIDTIASFKAAK